MLVLLVRCGHQGWHSYSIGERQAESAGRLDGKAKVDIVSKPRIALPCKGHIFFRIAAHVATQASHAARSGALGEISKTFRVLLPKQVMHKDAHGVSRFPHVRSAKNGCRNEKNDSDP